MQHPTSPLNGDFGVMIEGVTRRDLLDPTFQQEAFALWTKHGGLLALRGSDLADTTPDELMAWTEVFGAVEYGNFVAREDKMVQGFPILRIGNIRDEAGKLKASLARVPQLRSDADIRYDPATRRPVWHTDSTFRQSPPIGSVFHCKIAPESGGETLFADMRAAYADLDAETKARLDGLEAVCSLAHHDKKINKYSPDYPILTPEQRAANPPNRVPVVLNHPVSGEPALYGLNSSTCAILPKGEPIAPDVLDVCDLEGEEHESVQILRGLLPTITGPAYTVKWAWQPGDIVTWDNRCTIHSATGYDYERYSREMWRLTLLVPERKALAAE
ncbi:MAG: TauD/TfdA family dioxygenase [Alphaproteobacteria bacterium]|nr:TauD/TfdA family dioxygenase [Alphaproteobacteria bacterium]MCB9931363.1 TauD/TfdA family dioxygenase [Alphaproteobacteria bacterium]